MVVIQAAVNSVLSQIGDIDGCVHATKQDLQFLLIEHPIAIRQVKRKSLVMEDMYVPEPLCIDHVRKTLEECTTLLLYLFREAIVRYAEDVLEFVVLRYRNVAAVGLEVNRSRNTKLCADRR